MSNKNKATKTNNNIRRADEGPLEKRFFMLPPQSGEAFNKD